MMHFFLDTNVVIDFLIDRRPYSLEAASLFMAAEEGKVRLYVSAITFNNIYYVVRRTEGHNKAMDLIETLDSLVLTIDLNSIMIRKAFRTTGRDFEDEIQIQSVRSSKKIQALITRDKKDFKVKNLVVLSPSEAVKLLESVD